MKNVKEMPERPEPHIPEIIPDTPAEPVKYPEIVPVEKPEPIHTNPEIKPVREH